MSLRNPRTQSPTPTPKTSPSATSTARAYYNSPSADAFYHTIWGGQDIHIGIYTSPSDTIPLASQRTVERMVIIADQTPILFPPIRPNATTRVLDLGAGYGGSARYLARTYGCHVTCLNLSEVQNARNRAKTQEEGLSALVSVVEGSFEALPFGDGVFDLVWSQDSFLHSSNRSAIVAEIARVMKRSLGHVVFTDPMAAEGADPARLVPIQRRLGIEGGLATKKFYIDAFEERGLVDARFEVCTEHLVTHYSKVLAALQDLGKDVGISDGFAENAKIGLEHWIEGGKQGQLEWGIFHFRK